MEPMYIGSRQLECNYQQEFPPRGCAPDQVSLLMQLVHLDLSRRHAPPSPDVLHFRKLTPWSELSTNDSGSFGGSSNDDALNVDMEVHRPKTRQRCKRQSRQPLAQKSASVAGSMTSSAKTQVGRHRKLVGTFRLLAPEEQLREFNFVSRFIGGSGCNVKRIAKGCNGKLRLRGRGSGYLGRHGKEEEQFSLRISLSCSSEEDYLIGNRMVTELLTRSSEQFTKLCIERGWEPPRKFFEESHDSGR
mmetsp:Transcript_100082/g.180552  ORF Transcript_100082/g.180552 Transcript_100082/m.180552 type:complete len:246 (-) Transcript_100082:159-896(-)